MAMPLLDVPGPPVEPSLSDTISRRGESSIVGRFFNICQDEVISAVTTNYTPLPGQYSDATTIEPYTLQRSRDRKCWTSLAVRSLIVSLIGVFVCLGAQQHYDHRHDRHQHDPSPSNKDRLESVLKCASILSDKTITAQSGSVYGRVVQYFVYGSGQLVEPVCNGEGSLFETLYSLIVVREKLDVKHYTWTDGSYNITSMTDICSWKRVTCSDGQLTGLILNNANLTSQLPPEISLLRDVISLRLFTNSKLVGTLPSELGLMSKLKNLEIHKTSISGAIPTSLGHLTSLEAFILYDTFLTGAMPTEICNLRLKNLRADCKGDSPRMKCHCCTHCGPSKRQLR